MDKNIIIGRVRSHFLLIVLSILLPSIHLYSQDSQFSIEPATHIGGELKKCQVQGNYAYLIQAQYLTILDLGGNQMVQISSKLLSHKVIAFYVSGNYVYLNYDGDQGFEVFDISDKTNPVSIGKCDLSGQNSGHMAVHGNYVYVTILNDGIRIIDVSDPASPGVVNTFDAGSFYSTIATGGGYLYAARAIRFRILDLSDPVNPVETGFIQLFSISDIAISGDVAVLGHQNANDEGVRFVDISDKSNPVELSFFSTTPAGQALRVTRVSVSGNFAYAATADDTWLYKLNMTDPTNPVETTKTLFPDEGYSAPIFLQATDSGIFLSMLQENEFKKLNTSDLSLTDRFQYPQFVRWVDLTDQRLYCASEEAFWIYDVSNDQTPALLNFYPEWNGITRFSAVDNKIYMVDGENYRILNAEDANNLFELGSYSFGAAPHEHFQSNGYAVFLTGLNSKNFEILDLSEPSAITRRGEYTITENGRDLFVDELGSTAWIAYEDGFSGGVLSLDISDLSAPTLLVDIATAYRPICIWKSDSLLFIGGNDNNDRFYVEAYDVTDPASPIKAGEYSDDGGLWDIEVINEYVFISVAEKGIHVLKINEDNGSLAKAAFFFNFNFWSYCPSMWPRQFAVTSTGLTSVETGYGNHDPDKGEYLHGEGGFDYQFISFPPWDVAVLSLGGSAVQSRYCAPEKDKKSRIMNFSLSADLNAGWNVSGLTVHGFGNGDEIKHIKNGKVLLKLGGTEYKGTYSREGKNDGVIEFAVSERINKGGSVSGYLEYEFEELECPACLIIEPGDTTDVLDFFSTISTADKDVSATAFDLEPDVLFTEIIGEANGGAVLLGCIQNVDTDKYFKTIEDAHDDENTRDDHTILVCPGSYQENVEVDKRLTIKSIKGPWFTEVYARKIDEPVFYVTDDDCVIEGFNIGYATAPNTEGIGFLQTEQNGKITVNSCRLINNGGSGIDCRGTLIVDDWIECINNGLWGIEVESGWIEINNDSLENPSGQTISKIKDNKRGGIINWTGSTYAHYLEVSHNGHGNSEGNVKFGHGIYAHNGFVGSSIRILDSKKSGLRVFGEELELKGPNNEISNNGHHGIHNLFETITIDAAKVEHNGAYGIWAEDGSIYINNFDPVMEVKYPSIISKFNDNGKSGIRAYKWLYGNYIEANNNGFTDVEIDYAEGCGIYARRGLIGSHIEASHNARFGIYVLSSSHKAIETLWQDKPSNYMRTNGNGYSGIYTKGGPFYLCPVDSKDNGHWGIYTKRGSVYINLNDAVGEPYQPGKWSIISGNKKGGIGAIAGGGWIDGNLLEVTNNGHNETHNLTGEGNGIYARRSVTLRDVKITNNYKNGIRIRSGYSGEYGYATFLYGQNNTISHNGFSGIHSYGSVLIEAADIHHNNYFGIYSRKGKICINTGNNITGYVVNPKVTKINNNGRGGIWAMKDYFARDQSIVANRLEVIHNGFGELGVDHTRGHGVACASQIILNHSTVKDNLKYGLYTLNTAKLKQVKIEENKQGGILYDMPLIPAENESPGLDSLLLDDVELDQVLVTTDPAFEHLLRTEGPSTIEACVLAENEGDAIHINHDVELKLTNSNVVDNHSFAINNISLGSPVNAQSNYWGDASGPSDGDLFGHVDASGWLEAPVALVVSPVIDTLYIPVAASDSVTCFFDNWEKPDDVVDVILSDSLGWLSSDSLFTLTFSDSAGADTIVQVITPPAAPIGTRNKFRIWAQSQFNNSWTAADSFTVIVYQSALERVEIFPDSVLLFPEESIQFNSLGLDAFSRPVPTDWIWSATGGSIDSTGLFTAGADTGWFKVFVEDPVFHIQDSAVVQIADLTHVPNRTDSPLPTQFSLSQNYPNPFNPQTTIVFGVKDRCHVSLIVYDIRGREVMRLVDESKAPGYFQTTFDAGHLASGMYLYRIQMKDFVKVKKMVLLE